MGGSLDSRSHNLKILMSRGNNIIRTVDELINPVNSTWDTDLVKYIFCAVYAAMILQIPITSGREDFVAWHYNRNGLFSVRSSVSLPMGGHIWAKKLLNARWWCRKESCLEEAVETVGSREDKNFRMACTPCPDSGPSNSC